MPAEYRKPIPNSFIHKYSESRKQAGDVIEVEKTVFQGKNLKNVNQIVRRFKEYEKYNYRNEIARL